jgi:hypothetical protein
LRRLFSLGDDALKNQSPSYLDWRKISTMRRIALLGTAVFGLAMAVAACGQSPVEPGTSTAATAADPLFGKKGSTQPVTQPTCESLVYPTSLCYPANRPALCAALRAEGTFYEAVVGRPAKEEFKQRDGKSVETVYIPRPYGLPPTVLTFTITREQIESAGLCLGVA